MQGIGNGCQTLRGSADKKRGHGFLRGWGFLNLCLPETSVAEKRQKKARHQSGHKGSSEVEHVRQVSADAIVAYTISAIRSQAICTDMVRTIGRLAIVAYMIGAVRGQSVCTDMVSTIGRLTIVAYMIGAVRGQAICADMVRTVGSLAIGTSVRSIGVGRTALGNNSASQRSMVIGNRQSECARRQNRQTKGKYKIRSFHDVSSTEVQ